MRTWLSLLLITLGNATMLLGQEQVYTPPELFRGTLYLATPPKSNGDQATAPGALNATQAAILNTDIDRTNNEGWLVGIGSKESAEHSAIWQLLSHRTWIEPTKLIAASDWDDAIIKQLQQMKRGSCLWLHQVQLEAVPEADRPSRAELLRQCLNRSVMIILEVEPTTTGASIADQWNLIPDVDLVFYNDKPLDSSDLKADRLRLQLTSGSLLRIGRRELVNLSEQASSISYCDCPATNTYPEPTRETIAQLKVVDLIAARRALAERRQSVFPSNQSYHPRLANGSLVIVGGGGAPPEIWEKFVELAGGKESRIVILPTAVAEPQFEDDDEVRLLKRFGASEVRVLPQNTKDDVSTEEYLSNLRWATGIWFGGGRQWRFVDAYWGTPAWREIQQVLARGGVIGGSSAGATIQGDLLVRGHPLGNQIMIADGYRRGLGLLEGVAIDQHFKQRNRFDDLAGVAKRFPKIHAVGIDESTALVVQSPNRCSVLGKGSVWLLPPDLTDHKFIEHASGNTFDLAP